MVTKTKVSAIEELERKLARDLAWRKMEIASLRADARSSMDTRYYFFRAALVMLSAHWEGFLKSSLRAYGEFVFAQRLRAKELATEFVALAFFNDVKRAAECDFPGSRDHHLRLAEGIIRRSAEEFSEFSYSFETGGNPGTDTLRKLMLSVGFDPHLEMGSAEWAAHRVYIDEQIVGDRNRVAHGEGLRITQDQFVERCSRMIELLERLVSLVLTAARDSRFKSAWARENHEAN